MRATMLTRSRVAVRALRTASAKSTRHPHTVLTAMVAVLAGFLLRLLLWCAIGTAIWILGLGVTMLAILAALAKKTFGLDGHLPTSVALCWLVTAWQCHACLRLQLCQDLHSELLLFLKLRGDEIPKPLGLAEMLKELAEVGQIVADLLTLTAHSELHHLKCFWGVGSVARTTLTKLHDGLKQMATNCLNPSWLVLQHNQHTRLINLSSRKRLTVDSCFYKEAPGSETLR